MCLQGLPQRGHSEADGNFQQVLKLKAEEDPNHLEWLTRKENAYMTPDIQNEVIKLMGIEILRDMAEILHISPFLTIMVDETTDILNVEQVAIFIRWVQELEVQCSLAIANSVKAKFRITRILTTSPCIAPIKTCTIKVLLSRIPLKRGG